MPIVMLVYAMPIISMQFHGAECKERFREFSKNAFPLQFRAVDAKFIELCARFTFTGREKFRFQYQATDAREHENGGF